MAGRPRSQSPNNKSGAFNDNNTSEYGKEIVDDERNDEEGNDEEMDQGIEDTKNDSFVSETGGVEESHSSSDVSQQSQSSPRKTVRADVSPLITRRKLHVEKVPSVISEIIRDKSPVRLSSSLKEKEKIDVEQKGKVDANAEHPKFDYKPILKMFIAFFCIFIIFIIIIIIIIISGFPDEKPIQEKQVRDQNQVMFASNWLNLKRSFPGQGERFWNVVGSATTSIIANENPNDPAVVLLVVPKSAVPSTVDCFLPKYTSAVTEFFGQRPSNVISFNCSKYVDNKPEDVKLRLDESLKDGFLYGWKVAVINHLETLSSEAAMMLYSYCDNDNAPYRRVVILLLLHLEPDEEYAIGMENDMFVMRKLGVMWMGKLGEDNFNPLLSRIGNSIAFLKPETGPSLAVNNCRL